MGQCNLEKYRLEMAAFIGTGAETSVFYEALDFAFAAHDGQMRKSGDPYIIHPCATARILAEEMDVHNCEILAAGLLHDTIEDVEDITPEVIREKFGPNVEAIVVGCTKVKHHSGDKQALKNSFIANSSPAQRSDQRSWWSSWRIGCITCAPSAPCPAINANALPKKPWISTPPGHHPRPLRPETGALHPGPFLQIPQTGTKAPAAYQPTGKES